MSAILLFLFLNVSAGPMPANVAIAAANRAGSGAIPYALAYTMKTMVSDDTVALSPDGEWVAYSVRTPHTGNKPAESETGERFFPNGTTAGITGKPGVVTKVRTGKTRPVGPNKANSWR